MTDSPDQIVTAAIVDALNHWYKLRNDPPEWVKLESASDGRVITIRVEPFDTDSPAAEVQLLITSVREGMETEPCKVGTMDQPDGTAAA